MLGCKISLKNIPFGGLASKSVDVALFSESQGRVLVTVAKENVKKFEKIVGEISFAKIGVVSKDNKFIITDAKNKKIVDTNIKKLFAIYHDFSNKIK